MLKWLRNILRSWLSDEERVDALECYIDCKIKRVVVEDAVGLKLMVTDGNGTWLVGQEQCVDSHELWVACGQRSKGDILWGDGTPFRPEETA
jgi:hypothetical protein